MLLSVGCDDAGTDPLDRQAQPNNGYGAVIAELIVDVTDRGTPIVADRVYVGNDDGPVGEAECIVHAGPDRCKVWSLRFEAVGPMTLFADVCGERHAEPFALDLGLVEEPFVAGMSVTLQADGLACARARPGGCDGETFAEPAIAIAAVDRDGKSVEVRDVRVHYNDEQPAPADCMEATAGGCSEWASQRTTPGRYRASVEVCNRTFVTEWVTVVEDESGCALHRKALALVVDDAGCRYAPQ